MGLTNIDKVSWGWFLEYFCVNCLTEWFFCDFNNQRNLPDLAIIICSTVEQPKLHSYGNFHLSILHNLVNESAFLHGHAVSNNYTKLHSGYLEVM